MPQAPIPPSLALPGLYERVALSPLFPDGKFWADAVPRREPADILRDYRSRPPANDVQLHAL